jgi:hypothetical protein
MTPLVEASRLGHAETVRALLDAGADANVVEPPNPATGERRSALGEALLAATATSRRCWKKRARRAPTTRRRRLAAEPVKGTPLISLSVRP